MRLQISVTSYHRLSPRLQSVMQFDKQGGSIGRSEECDWQLADPERFISGRHAFIGVDDNGFYVEDNSTNGLFYNKVEDLIGKGNRRQLKLGDVLLLGDYELQVSAIQTSDDVSKRCLKEQLGSDLVSSSASDSPLHAMSLDDVPVGKALPVQHHVSPQAHSALEHSSIDFEMDAFFDVQPLIPDDWSTEDLDTNEQEWSDLPAQPAHTTEAYPGASSPGNNYSSDRNLKAFVDGLGLTDEQVAMLQSNDCAWRLFGEALRASLDGLMLTLRARSEIKNLLRVNQTTFQARENNPLKFSASFDDVFHTLFVNSKSGYLSPSQSVHAAFQDINKHELALIEATRASNQSLLERLSPDAIASKDVGRGVMDKLSNAHVKSRYWSLYQLYYKDLKEQLEKNQRRGFSEDFIDAYERTIKSAK